MNGTLAVLAMYPYPSVSASWDRLYEAVAAEVPDAPTALRWDIDVHKTWLDPNLAIGMACGWPLVQTLGDAVRVIGTFSYDASEPGSHLYRSVIIARDDVPLARLADGHAAINSTDSLSGYVSLLSAFGLDTAWPGRVTFTGAHTASIEAVRSGAADVAAIDGVTWALHQRDAARSLVGLTVVGRGPSVPGLPIIVPATTSDDRVAAWRSGLHRAVADPALAADIRRLMIRRFVALDNADYSTDLTDLRRRHLVRT
jgi:ABC-type phosphate/phosphonate transport system substrate-binding protein